MKRAANIHINSSFLIKSREVKYRVQYPRHRWEMKAKTENNLCSLRWFCKTLIQKMNLCSLREGERQIAMTNNAVISKIRLLLWKLNSLRPSTWGLIIINAGEDKNFVLNIWQKQEAWKEQHRHQPCSTISINSKCCRFMTWNVHYLFRVPFVRRWKREIKI